MDPGETWSAGTTIVDQVPNTPNECNALDGDVFYDAPSNTWHFLYQCMDRSLQWNICHSSHVGATPEARFVDDPANPVVHNGDLWKLILGPSRESSILHAICRLAALLSHCKHTINTGRTVRKSGCFSVPPCQRGQTVATQSYGHFLWRGGAIVVLASRASITNSGTITATGGDGQPSDTKDGPGGGGIVHLIAPAITEGSLTVTGPCASHPSSDWWAGERARIRR